MTLQIGLKTQPPEGQQGLVEVMLDCHERIRTFIRLACKLAEAEHPPAEQVRDAAARVHRYFAEALPLHVKDEEETLVPRLKGLHAELDAALALMSQQHAEHAAGLSQLLSVCQALEEAPEQHPVLASKLLDVATLLSQEFDDHLAREESVIFPAIQQNLAPEAQAQMLAELRGRRQTHRS